MPEKGTNWRQVEGKALQHKIGQVQTPCGWGSRKVRGMQGTLGSELVEMALGWPVHPIIQMRKLGPGRSR